MKQAAQVLRKDDKGAKSHMRDDLISLIVSSSNTTGYKFIISYLQGLQEIAGNEHSKNIYSLYTNNNFLEDRVLQADSKRQSTEANVKYSMFEHATKPTSSKEPTSKLFANQGTAKKPHAQKKPSAPVKQLPSNKQQDTQGDIHVMCGLVLSYNLINLIF